MTINRPEKLTSGSYALFRLHPLFESVDFAIPLLAARVAASGNTNFMAELESRKYDLNVTGCIKKLKRIA